MHLEMYECGTGWVRCMLGSIIQIAGPCLGLPFVLPVQCLYRLRQLVNIITEGQPILHSAQPSDTLHDCYPAMPLPTRADIQYHFGFLLGSF